MPSCWPWRRWTLPDSFFTMPTGERNDFGECFFGRARLVTAAGICLPRKNSSEGVCRGQSSLTFSGTRKFPTGKSYAPCLGACDRHSLNCVLSHSKAAGYMGTDGFAFVAHTRRLPVGRWVVSRFGDVRFGS